MEKHIRNISAPGQITISEFESQLTLKRSSRNRAKSCTQISASLEIFFKTTQTKDEEIEMSDNDDKDAKENSNAMQTMENDRIQHLNNMAIDEVNIFMADDVLLSPSKQSITHTRRNGGIMCIDEEDIYMTSIDTEASTSFHSNRPEDEDMDSSDNADEKPAIIKPFSSAPCNNDADNDHTMSDVEPAFAPPTYIEVDTEYTMSETERDYAAYIEADANHGIADAPDYAPPAYIEENTDYEISEADLDHES